MRVLTMKAFLILLAAVAALVLALLVLIDKPDNSFDLLAGASLATCFAFIVFIFPER